MKNNINKLFRNFEIAHSRKSSIFVEFYFTVLFEVTKMALKNILSKHYRYGNYIILIGKAKPINLFKKMLLRYISFLGGKVIISWSVIASLQANKVGINFLSLIKIMFNLITSRFVKKRALLVIIKINSLCRKF